MEVCSDNTGTSTRCPEPTNSQQAKGASGCRPASQTAVLLLRPTKQTVERESIICLVGTSGPSLFVFAFTSLLQWNDCCSCIVAPMRKVYVSFDLEMSSECCAGFTGINCVLHKLSRFMSKDYTPFTLKPRLRWEPGARRTNCPPPSRHLTQLSARGYGRKCDDVAKVKSMTGPTRT